MPPTLKNKQRNGQPRRAQSGTSDFEKITGFKLPAAKTSSVGMTEEQRAVDRVLRMRTGGQLKPGSFTGSRQLHGPVIIAEEKDGLRRWSWDAQALVTLAVSGPGAGIWPELNHLYQENLEDWHVILESLTPLNGKGSAKQKEQYRGLVSAKLDELGNKLGREDGPLPADVDQVLKDLKGLLTNLKDALGVDEGNIHTQEDRRSYFNFQLLENDITNFENLWTKASPYFGDKVSPSNPDVSLTLLIKRINDLESALDFAIETLEAKNIHETDFPFHTISLVEGARTVQSTYQKFFDPIREFTDSSIPQLQEFGMLYQPSLRNNFDKLKKVGTGWLTVLPQSGYSEIFVALNHQIDEIRTILTATSLKLTPDSEKLEAGKSEWNLEIENTTDAPIDVDISVQVGGDQGWMISDPSGILLQPPALVGPPAYRIQLQPGSTQKYTLQAFYSGNLQSNLAHAQATVTVKVGNDVIGNFNPYFTNMCQFCLAPAEHNVTLLRNTGMNTILFILKNLGNTHEDYQITVPNMPAWLSIPNQISLATDLSFPVVVHTNSNQIQRQRYDLQIEVRSQLNQAITHIALLRITFV